MLDKRKIGKADGNVAKGARASRLQRNKMVKFLPLLLFFIVKANEFKIFINMYSRSRFHLSNSYSLTIRTGWDSSFGGLSII